MGKSIARRAVRRQITPEIESQSEAEPIVSSYIHAGREIQGVAYQAKTTVPAEELLPDEDEWVVIMMPRFLNSPYVGRRLLRRIETTRDGQEVGITECYSAYQELNTHNLESPQLHNFYEGMYFVDGGTDGMWSPHFPVVEGTRICRIRQASPHASPGEAPAEDLQVIIGAVAELEKRNFS